MYVKYDNAAGLGKNAAVTILGIKVGYVELVVLSNAGHIDVTMKLRQDCVRLVKEDSRARLIENVAIGDWEVEIPEERLARGRRKRRHAYRRGPGAHSADAGTGQ